MYLLKNTLQNLKKNPEKRKQEVPSRSVYNFFRQKKVQITSKL